MFVATFPNLMQLTVGHILYVLLPVNQVGDMVNLRELHLPTCLIMTPKDLSRLLHKLVLLQNLQINSNHSSGTADFGTISLTAEVLRSMRPLKSLFINDDPSGTVPSCTTSESIG